MAIKPGKFGGRILTILLMVGLVVVFILWLVQDVSLQRLQGLGAAGTIGMVDGQPVTGDRSGDFAREYGQMVQRYRDQGIEMSDDIERMVREQAFNQVAMRILLTKKAERLGITVSDEDILNYIKQRYFTEKGRFNQAGYMQFQQQGQPSDKIRLEREARQTLSMEILSTLTLFSYFPVSSAEAFDRWQSEQLKKKAKIAVLSLEGDLKGFATEAEITGWAARSMTNEKGMPFTANRDEVVKRYVAEHESILRSRAKAAAMQKVQARMTDGSLKTAFDATAAALGMTVRKTDSFNLFTQVLEDDRGKTIAETASSEVVQALMEGAPGQVIGPMDLGSALVLAVVTEIQDKPLTGADFQNAAVARQRTEDRLRREKMQSAVYAFQEQLFKSGKVESAQKNVAGR